MDQETALAIVLAAICEGAELSIADAVRAGDVEEASKQRHELAIINSKILESGQRFRNLVAVGSQLAKRPELLHAAKSLVRFEAPGPGGEVGFGWRPFR
jgi:hypothetical protein